MPQTKYRRSSEKSENKQLSAFAQEFRPNEEVPAEPLDFQDFPLPSDDYVSYDYNPYLALSPEDSMYYSDRKPLRDCDRLEGLDFSTFVVFSNVKNIPLEMNIAEPGDGPARLRLCTHGYDCIRRTIDCPYTHIPNDEGTWNDPDPDARQDLGDKQSNTTPTNSPSSLNKKLIKPSISFSSTTSIASTISSSRSSSFSQEHYDYSLSDNSSSPPDSPTPTTRSSSLGSAYSTTSEDSLLYRSLSHNFVEDNKKMKKKEVLRAKLITRATTSPPLTTTPTTTTTTTTASRKNSEVLSNGSSTKKKIITTTTKNLNNNGSSKKNNNNTQKNYRAKKISTSTSSATTRSKTRNPTS